MEYNVVPGAISTTPEVSNVGITGAQVKEHGVRLSALLLGVCGILLQFYTLCLQLCQTSHGRNAGLVALCVDDLIQKRKTYGNFNKENTKVEHLLRSFILFIKSRRMKHNHGGVN